MRAFGAASLAVVLLSAQPSSASGRARTAKVFLLDDAANKRWCAYSKEATWNGAVQKVGAVTVGALNYSGDHLLQIDVTETDESGDWTVYDHYVLDDRRQVIRLSRTINVLPEDRSVLQTFSISDGHATRTATTEKRLSTGELRSSPRSAWASRVANPDRDKAVPVLRSPRALRLDDER
jgi:hypothetical protein